MAVTDCTSDGQLRIEGAENYGRASPPAADGRTHGSPPDTTEQRQGSLLYQHNEQGLRIMRKTIIMGGAIALSLGIAGPASAAAHNVSFFAPAGQGDWSAQG